MQAGRQAGRKTDIQEDRQVGEQVGEQAGSRTGKQIAGLSESCAGSQPVAKHEPAGGMDSPQVFVVVASLSGILK